MCLSRNVIVLEVAVQLSFMYVQVAAELGARPSTEQFLLSEDEQADADEASGGEHQGPESDNVSSSALQVLADRHWPDGSGSNHTASSHDVVDVTAASHAAQPPMWQSQQVHDIGTGNHAAGDTVQKAKKLQPV